MVWSQPVVLRKPQYLSDAEVPLGASRGDAWAPDAAVTPPEGGTTQAVEKCGERRKGSEIVP